MPNFKKGNIWSVKDQNEWIVITTNSYLKKDGSLAMGKGCAKEALELYPLLDKLIGGFISKTCGHLGYYGIAVVKKYNLIALQTKYHFKDKPNITLILQSVTDLKNYVESYNIQKVNMVFPGIGYGQLDTLEVYENVLKFLPEKFTIWTNE